MIAKPYPYGEGDRRRCPLRLKRFPNVSLMLRERGAPRLLQNKLGAGSWLDA